MICEVCRKNRGRLYPFVFGEKLKGQQSGAILLGMDYSLLCEDCAAIGFSRTVLKAQKVAGFEFVSATLVGTGVFYGPSAFIRGVAGILGIVVFGAFLRSLLAIWRLKRLGAEGRGELSAIAFRKNELSKDHPWTFWHWDSLTNVFRKSKRHIYNSGVESLLNGKLDLGRGAAALSQYRPHVLETKFWDALIGKGIISRWEGIRESLVQYLVNKMKPNELLSEFRDSDPQWRLWALKRIRYSELDQTERLDVLASAVRDPEWHIRKEAAEQLVDPRFIGALISLLNDEQSEVRRAAAFSLGNLGDSKGLEPLITALNDEDPNVACAAAEALGKMGSPDGVEALVGSLRNKSNWVRLKTVEALGTIDDLRCIRGLMKAFQDHDVFVRQAAEKHLEKHHGTDIEATRVLDEVRKERRTAKETISQLIDRGLPLWEEESLRALMAFQHLPCRVKELIQCILYPSWEEMIPEAQSSLKFEPLYREHVSVPASDGESDFSNQGNPYSKKGLLLAAIEGTGKLPGNSIRPKLYLFEDGSLGIVDTIYPDNHCWRHRVFGPFRPGQLGLTEEDKLEIRKTLTKLMLRECARLMEISS